MAGVTSGASAAPGRVRRFLARLALALGAVVAVLAGTELAFRAAGLPRDGESIPRKLEGFRANVRVGQLREEELAGNEGRILHPYYGWEILAERGEMEEEYRRHLAGLDGDAFQVWVVGGSVARYFAASEAVGHFAALLAEDPRTAGRPVRVVNHGRIAMKQPQQLFLVQYLLNLGLAPDLLVNIDGFNETAIANENVALGTHPAYPSADMWAIVSTSHENDEGSMERLLALWSNRRAMDRLAGFALDSGLLASRAFAWWAERRLTRMQNEYVALRADYLEWVGSRPDNAAARGIPVEGLDVPAELERVWYESSRLLHAACAARGIEYLHVLQPTLHDAGSKPLTEDEVQSGAAPDSWIEGVRAGYPRLRAAGARLAAEGVRFVDATQAFAAVEQKLYYDPCHFNVAGNWILGELIAAAWRAPR